MFDGVTARFLAALGMTQGSVGGPISDKRQDKTTCRKNKPGILLDVPDLREENTRLHLARYGFLVVSEGYSSGQRGQTVNLLTYVYEGSNPSPSTILYGCLVDSMDG